MRHWLETKVIFPLLQEMNGLLEVLQNQVTRQVGILCAKSLEELPLATSTVHHCNVVRMQFASFDGKWVIW